MHVRIFHIERFMVIEICPNMLLRGRETTIEHARMNGLDTASTRTRDFQPYAPAIRVNP